MRAVFTDLTNESYALAREGPDQPLIIATVADRSACGVDPRGQGRVRNDASMPYLGKQVVPADDAFAVADQVLQKIKNLRLNGRQSGAAAQLAAVCVERAVFEQIAQFGRPDDRPRPFSPDTSTASPAQK